jgi:hypothetical protein
MRLRSNTKRPSPKARPPPPPSKSKKKPTTKKSKKKKIYCGNNRNHREILNGESDIGTPYKCMQKGFMFGRHHMPVDPTYADNYAQLMPRKIWCGKETLSSERLRNRRYDFNGTLPECYRYGLGAGRRAKALDEEEHDEDNE